MSHYWTADDPTESRREQLIDWIEDLVEFGAAAVADACTEWRRAQSRRPTPSDIRMLCVEAQRQYREHQALMLAGDAGGRPLSYQERRAALDAIKRANEPADMANYERLKRIAVELSGGRRIATPAHAASSLGVTAREYTPAEMRAGRIALGIEAAE